LNVLVNEHRLYLPVAGLALLVARTWPWRRQRHAVLWAGVAVICVNATLTYQRNDVWSDELTLWQDAARRSPAMPRAHVHLGNAWRERGDLAAARGAYERALAVDPDHRAARTNLGNLLLAAAERDPEHREDYLSGAMSQYNAVLRIDPDHAEALNNLGSVQLMRGELERAAKTYARVIQSHPNFPDAYYNLGLVARDLGDAETAAQRLEQALALRADAEFGAELGAVRAGQRQWLQAAAAFRTAVRLEPGEAQHRYNLAQVLLAWGQEEGAAGRDARRGALWRDADHELQRLVREHPGETAAADLLARLEAISP
jgi:protein O-mannosyl-transferase